MKGTNQRDEEEEPIPEIEEDDTTWSLVSNSRVKPAKKIDLAVERLKDDTSAEKLEAYILARCKKLTYSVTIHRVKVFPLKEGREEVCARITVNASDASKLKRRGFWPGRLYCRDWQYTDSGGQAQKTNTSSATESSKSNSSMKADHGISNNNATPGGAQGSKRPRESPLQPEVEQLIFERDPRTPAFARWTGPRPEQVRRTSIH